MKQSTFFWVFINVVLILAILITLEILRGEDDIPFKKVTLSENNAVTNYTRYAYLDTIAYVGLDSLGVSAIKLEIKKLSNVAKKNMQQGYNLRGLIYGSGTRYTMWIDDANRNEHINIVAHELIHLHQYYTKQLVYDGFYVYWNRAKYDIKEIDYESRPWEADAFEKEVLLRRKINATLK